jgi:hypothetical protein
VAPERVPAWQTPASPPLSGTRRATSCAAARTSTGPPNTEISCEGRRPLTIGPRQLHLVVRLPPATPRVPS